MTDRPDVPEIDVAEAARRVGAGEVLLLDVRQDDEWQAGHAPQSVHVPLTELAPDRIPTGRPVVVVCRSGNGRHTRPLRWTLPATTCATAGGMRAWAAAGLPVVTPDGSPGRVE